MFGIFGARVGLDGLRCRGCDLLGPLLSLLGVLRGLLPSLVIGLLHFDGLAFPSICHSSILLCFVSGGSFAWETRSRASVVHGRIMRREATGPGRWTASRCLVGRKATHVQC